MLPDSQPKNRLFFIDLLRIYLTILVFYHHSVISFGATGGWYYYVTDKVEGISQALLSLTTGIDQSYFMSLFFFISAYFLPRSFDKKGAKKFIKDRFNRLLLPLLIFVFLIHPLLVYGIYHAVWYCELGPMWFVLTLILFEMSYVGYRTISHKVWKMKWNLPGVLPVTLFIVAMGTIAFLVRMFVPTGASVFGLQLGYFPLYVGMYVLGIIANRNNWLQQLSMKVGYFWLLSIILVVIPVFMFAAIKCPDGSMISGGWNIYAAVYAFWEPVMCVGMSYFLLVFCRVHLNFQNKFTKWLAGDSFAFYVIHPVILVACTMYVETLPLAPLTRLGIELLVGIPLCFIAGDLFKRSMNLCRIHV